MPKSHSADVFRKAQDREIAKSGLTRPIRLIHVPLDGDEDEVLVTTLVDSRRFPADGFKALYFKRWGVEEDYKKLKSRVHIEQFSGKKLRAVLQDLYATVIHKNLVALGVMCAQALVDKQKKKTEYRQKVNFTQAARFAKAIWTTTGRKSLTDLAHNMAKHCHSTARNRSFARNKTPKRPPSMAYKAGGA